MSEKMPTVLLCEEASAVPVTVPSEVYGLVVVPKLDGLIIVAP